MRQIAELFFTHLFELQTNYLKYLGNMNYSLTHNLKMNKYLSAWTIYWPFTTSIDDQTFLLKNSEKQNCI